MGESITFDRAVEYYDRTRALPAEMQTAMAEAVSAQLRGRGRVLEIGVGTGRIALPLHEAGVDVTGIDLSAPMLERLLDKAPNSIPAVQGDATRLPFRDRSFGAAYAVHVLHLIPDWKTAVDELVRVVEPGGTILVSQRWWSLIPHLDIIETFATAAGIKLRHIGLNDEAELDSPGSRAGPHPHRGERDINDSPDGRPPGKRLLLLHVGSHRRGTSAGR